MAEGRGLDPHALLEHAPCSKRAKSLDLLTFLNKFMKLTPAQQIRNIKTLLENAEGLSAMGVLKTYAHNKNLQISGDKVVDNDVIIRVSNNELLVMSGAAYLSFPYKKYSNIISAANFIDTFVKKVKERAEEFANARDYLQQNEEYFDANLHYEFADDPAYNELEILVLLEAEVQEAYTIKIVLKKDTNTFSVIYKRGTIFEPSNLDEAITDAIEYVNTDLRDCGVIPGYVAEERDPTMSGLDKIKRYFRSKNYFVFQEEISPHHGSASFQASEDEGSSRFYKITEITVGKEQEYTVFFHGFSGEAKMLAGHTLTTHEEVIELLDSLNIQAGKYQRTASRN